MKHSNLFFFGLGKFASNYFQTIENKFNKKFKIIAVISDVKVFELIQNAFKSFSEIKNKADYMNLEIKRFINFHKIKEFQFNPFFPINTITIQRGSLVAKEEGIFSQYTDITAKAMWEQQINLGDAQILIDTLNTAGIDGKMIVDKASDPKIKESLIKNTQMAVDNGAFGVPTFFLHDDVFFGKEALREIPDFL